MASIIIKGHRVHSIDADTTTGAVLILMHKPEPDDEHPEPIHPGVYIYPSWTITFHDNGNILIEQ